MILAWKLCPVPVWNFKSWNTLIWPKKKTQNIVQVRTYMPICFAQSLSNLLHLPCFACLFINSISQIQLFVSTPHTNGHIKSPRESSSWSSILGSHIRLFFLLHVITAIKLFTLTLWGSTSTLSREPEASSDWGRCPVCSHIRFLFLLATNAIVHSHVIMRKHINAKHRDRGVLWSRQRPADDCCLTPLRPDTCTP